MTRKQAAKRQSSRPGRKPLTTEPKDKRTAQNRAAQRAFRERKERKMRELESKVKMLENEKLQITNEKDLLRSQVQTLLHELSMYRKQQPGGFTNNTTTGSGSPDIQRTSPSSLDPSDSSISSTSTPRLNGSTETPRSSATSTTSLAASGKKYAPFVGATFQFPSEWEITGDKKAALNQSSFKGDFDESVSEFCADLNNACGTKECPIPKDKKQQLEQQYADSPAVLSGTSGKAVTEKPTDSPFFDLIESANPGEVKPTDEMNFMLDSAFKTPNPAAFSATAVDDDFTNVVKHNDEALDDETLGGLVTESSKYDPLDDLLDDTNLINDNITPSTLPPFEFDEKDSKPAIAAAKTNTETVPNRAGKLMPCSQIWERITTHPRFSEIDIDGLCRELKQKAKCTENGVVVDGGDVGKLIDQAIDKKKQGKVEENRFLKGLTC